MPSPSQGQPLPKAAAAAPAASKRRMRRRVIGGICALILASAGTIALLAACGASHGVVYQNTFAANAEGWDHSPSCFLGAGGYHVVGPGVDPGRSVITSMRVVAAGCDFPTDTLGDVDISVQVQQIAGPFSAGQGVYFRQGGLGNTGYEFAIDSSGVWWFTLCAAKLNGVGRGASPHLECHYLTAPTATAAAHSGLSATNTLEVRAKGSHFEFFVNGVKVGTADDSTLTDGYTQLAVGPDNESVFSNLVVTILS